MPPNGIKIGASTLYLQPEMKNRKKIGLYCWPEVILTLENGDSENQHMLCFLLTETSIFMCIMNEAQFLGYEINIITSVVQVLFNNNGQKSTMSKCFLVIYF